ncbi:MAG: dipeptide epimerase [Cyanobacteria bacterium P01_D01_bin.105]
MQIEIQPFTVHKRVPLTISRGTHSGSTNLWLRIRSEGIEGWGEGTPFSIGDKRQTTEQIERDLTAVADALKGYHPLQRQAVDALMFEANICSAARAAVDVAMHDWFGKSVNLPLWQLWGLACDHITPTAVTVGISSPADAAVRLQKWCAQQSVASVKIKLGSPEGIEADQAMFEATLAEVPEGAKVSIDANGGWHLQNALKMAHWLKARGVIYLEQPLAVADDEQLPELYEKSPLPIFIDESCFTVSDIPRLAHCVHGINIKLMKCGGLSEAQRMIHTARACNLQVMFGCYSDSAISNTALSHLSPLADHLDLDSHFNLKDDPFIGSQLHNGALIPNPTPGLGLTRHAQT